MLSDMLDRMADAVRAVEVDGLQVHGRMLLNPTPPSIDMYPGDPFQEGLAFPQETGRYTFTVRARISTADHEAQQETLLQLMERSGPTSVLEALNGVGRNVRVEGPSGYRTFEWPRPLLGCEWSVIVLS